MFGGFDFLLMIGLLLLITFCLPWFNYFKIKRLEEELEILERKLTSSDIKSDLADRMEPLILFGRSCATSASAKTNQIRSRCISLWSMY